MYLHIFHDLYDHILYYVENVLVFFRHFKLNVCLQPFKKNTSKKMLLLKTPFSIQKYSLFGHKSTYLWFFSQKTPV